MHFLKKKKIMSTLSLVNFLVLENEILLCIHEEATET